MNKQNSNEFLNKIIGILNIKTHRIAEIFGSTTSHVGHYVQGVRTVTPNMKKKFIKALYQILEEDQQNVLLANKYLKEWEKQEVD